MRRSNRAWLPRYCSPDDLLPRIPETRALFSRRPYLVQDFVGKTISFLNSDEARKMGLEYDERCAIPCKWRCADESLFGVDLAIYAYTRAYPFDKGRIGGYFNEASIGAAVHHGRINVDLGGSHVGYVPGPDGGSFGRVWRPAEREYSTDCGHLMAVISPFKQIYDDACDNILVCQPEGERVLVSIPNEFIQPTWSSHPIKLLVDPDTLTDGEVEYDHHRPHTHTLIGRSLFYAHPDFIAHLPEDELHRLTTTVRQRIGHSLTHRYFNIFDAEAELDEEGLPRQRLLLYMKFILSARHSPEGLKAAVINTSLEHNRLTDAVRAGPYIGYDFISFSGVFIDIYSKDARSYVNLFQPMGMTIKPRGKTRELEFTPEEIHEIFDRIPVAEPRMPLKAVLDYDRPESALESFTYEPGRFTRT